MTLPARDRDLVQIMDAALADAARRAGGWLACRPGCTQCCCGAFAINELDSLRLAEGMEALRGQNPRLAAEIERRASAWIAEHGTAFPGDHETGRLGTSGADRASFEDYADDAQCPALDPTTGRCDLYAWRPMTCRVFGPPVRSVAPDGSEGLSHCELCFTCASREQIATCEMPVPHAIEQELLDQIHCRDETVVAYALLRKRAR